MMRSERYALIQLDGENPELYNMLRDPKQTRNLLRNASAQATQLLENFQALRTRMLQ